MAMGAGRAGVVLRRFGGGKQFFCAVFGGIRDGFPTDKASNFIHALLSVKCSDLGRGGVALRDFVNFKMVCRL